MPDAQEYEVELTSLVYGGDAMGRLPDGRAVFVPYALAGEKVRLRLLEEKRGFCRAELLQVIRPSPQRIRPRCIHFAVCGGCHYQHLPYPAQLAAKEAITREQLARIAGLPDPPVKPIRPSPGEWNYRNSLQFHLTRDGQIGYQMAGSHQVVPITECHLPEKPLDELWKQLDFEPGSGLERLELRLGENDEAMLDLEGSEPNPPEFSVDFPISAVYHSSTGETVLSGVDFVLVEVMGFPFQVSASSFFQVNTPQAEAMVKHVLGLLPAGRQPTVLDLYCGVGLFSAFLAPRVERLIGIESAPSACEDFAANLDRYDNVELYEGQVEEILPHLAVRPGAVMADPPRAGIALPAMDAMIALHPPAIIYVSCDPSTLARDTRRLLKAGYNLVQVTPFDLFPQTYHIENVALFSLS
jgi:23S rRNA (uracil1939-C5)-methyltransferase